MAGNRVIKSTKDIAIIAIMTTTDKIIGDKFGKIKRLCVTSKP